MDRAARAIHVAPRPEETDYVYAEVRRLRNAVEGEDGVGGIKGELASLKNRLTLFFGLGIGALASSGLISTATAHLLKAIAGLQ